VKQQIGPQTFIVKPLINQQHGQLSYLYQKERRGKEASCRRDRDRECVRDGESLKMEVGSVVKAAIGGSDHFGIS